MPTSNPSGATSMLSVEAAFLAHLDQHLQTLGYFNNDLSDLRSLAIRATNVSMRAISRQARRVELPAPPFVVDSSLEAGFKQLCQAAERGDDLLPYQSKLRLNKADFHDDLLTDWGIHHFHLGTAPDPADPRFMKRTGPVLYAFLTDDRFLALGIDNHGEWSNPTLLEILHRNWPEELAACRLTDQVLGALETKDDIKAFRDAGVNGAVKLGDGTVYRSYTLGRTLDGTPTDAVWKATLLLRNVRVLQKHLDEKFAGMRDNIVARRSVDPASLAFSLVVEREGGARDAGVWLDEATTGYSYYLHGPTE